MFFKKISDKIKRIFAVNPGATTQLFTLYVPAPPTRSTCYREKELDRIIDSLTQKGFELLNVKTATHDGPTHAGMWVLCTIRATDGSNKKLELSFPESNTKEKSKEIKLDSDFTIVHD